MTTRITVGLIGVLLAVATTNGATIWGYCHLEGQDNEGLTKVTLSGVLPRETQTDCAGRYEFSLVLPGWHTLTYSHPGFISETREVYVDLDGGRLPDVTLASKVICDPDDWCYYPYTIPGTNLTFPGVEGVHQPTSSYPIEWWYVNFQLTVTDDPDRQYGGFIAFFKPPVIGLPCMVLQSVIDLQDGVPYYQHYEFPLIFSSNDQWLDVIAGGNRLYNVACGGDHLPFEYHLYSGWMEGFEAVMIELDMKSLKPPIAVSGDGFVEFGDAGWSYYYSSPHLDVQGTLNLPGFSAAKPVHGTAWLDHQWANFPSEIVTWEWLSIQLCDGREIMVADVWVDGVPLGSFSGGLNYYDRSCGLEVLDNYDLTPLASYVDPVTGREFATQWHLTQPSRHIDLIVTADYDHQVMRIGENQIFKTCFWEGSCTVFGWIGQTLVSGTAYAESTHEYGQPDPHPGGKKQPMQR
jgi:predicted secreted hydrolase